MLKQIAREVKAFFGDLLLVFPEILDPGCQDIRLGYSADRHWLFHLGAHSGWPCMSGFTVSLIEQIKAAAEGDPPQLSTAISNWTAFKAAWELLEMRRAQADFVAERVKEAPEAFRILAVVFGCASPDSGKVAA